MGSGLSRVDEVPDYTMEIQASSSAAKKAVGQPLTKRMIQRR